MRTCSHMFHVPITCFPVQSVILSPLKRVLNVLTSLNSISLKLFISEEIEIFSLDPVVVRLIVSPTLSKMFIRPQSNRPETVSYYYRVLQCGVLQRQAILFEKSMDRPQSYAFCIPAKNLAVQIAFMPSHLLQNIVSVLFVLFNVPNWTISERVLPVRHLDQT